MPDTEVRPEGRKNAGLQREADSDRERDRLVRLCPEYNNYISLVGGYNVTFVLEES